MRSLAHIERITSLTDIPERDFIELATVLGWQVIVKKGEFKVGDLAIYCEIDSILPEKPEFEFLRSKKFRIKTMKMRGVLSQGILFPVSFIGCPLSEGADVTDILGVKKYESDPEPVQQDFKGNKLKKYLMRYSWFRRMVFRPTRGSFPSFISKTDEVRVQNLTSLVEKLYNEGTSLSVTEKLDGSSITMFVVKEKILLWTKYRFGVCSRNFELFTKDNNFWKAVEMYGVESRMRAYVKHLKLDGLVVQGELIGPNVQGNKYKLDKLEIHAFNVLDLQGNDYISGDTGHPRFWVDSLGVKHVPFLGTIPALPTVQDYLTEADGKSVINSATDREGLVFRAKGVSFKAVSNAWLLKNEE